ncbi:hypothetical protein BN59_00613 [Legionella massiliensis]|uniref:Uncharacterized protein n=1 Tax=Legionella massiliensis TaxID=1034943 RepID=A0A078KPL0_9GAMM|nr:hypothetical protein [Legionella massiliensis]CDZ76345.1 hypothetical protein BN59_00613 [Legionella massiliensis]CEE12083.1 hypothetical protein BN1094_00613 [Legionella massiliensis]
MNKKLLITAGLFTLLNCFGITHAETSRATYSIELAPGYFPTMPVALNATATIKYTVRNLEGVPRILTMLPISPVINQVATTPDACSTPVFFLASGQSCTLELQINGALMAPNQVISSYPTVCKTVTPGRIEPDPNRCSRTSIPLTISSSNANPSLTPVEQTIAFYTSYTNSMTLPIDPTLPEGFTPLRVQPIVTFFWNLFAKAFNGQTGIPSSADLLSASCGKAVNNKTYCALVGKIDKAPFIMQSYDGGTTWEYPLNLVLPAEGKIRKVSCATDPSGTNTCVAIGDIITGVTTSTPFVIQTVDNGKTWFIVHDTTTVQFSQSILNSVNCTASAANSLCQITGFNAGPVIFNYTPSSDWKKQSLSMLGVDPAARASAISCVSLANSNISCLVALSTSGNSIRLFKTQLSGGVYSTTPVELDPQQFSNIQIFGVSCTQNALNANAAFCIGVGSQSDANSQSGRPFILQNSGLSSDNNWVPVHVTSSEGLFITASCASFNGQVSCVAVGISGSFDSPSPLLAATMDGSSWAIVTTDGVPSLGYYTSSACSVNSQGLFCFANGMNALVEKPFSVGMPGTNGGWQFSNTFNNVFTSA